LFWWYATALSEGLENSLNVRDIRFWRIVVACIEATLPRYDFGSEVVGLLTPWLLRRMAVGLGTGSKALDVGVGTGALSKQLLKRYRYVIGLDASFKMAREALRRLGGERFDAVVGLAEEMPLREECVDAAYMAFTYRDLIDHGKALAEIRRALVRGGTLVSADIGRPRGPAAVLPYVATRFLARVLGGFMSLGIGFNPWRALYATYLRLHDNGRVVELARLILGYARIIEILGGSLYVLVAHRTR